MANATTPIAVYIPPQGYEELAQLAAHAGQLQEVLDIAAEFRFGANREAISKGISERTGITPYAGHLLLTGIATLRNLMDSTGAKPDELLRAISQTVAVDAPEEWRKLNLDKLGNASPAITAAFAAITDDHPLLARQKATALTYAHQNIFRASRIITDLRPVFNVSGDQIRAIVLTHVLGVEYFDGVRNQRIEFALDEADVEALRKSAERAQTKTKATRKEFGGKWELIVAGDTVTEEDDK